MRNKTHVEVYILGLLLIIITIFYTTFRFENKHYIPKAIPKSILSIPKKVNDRWIIVTSINYPTTQIQTLAQIKGFQLIVVGDNKTKPDWFYQNVTYLSIQSQEQLGYKSYKTTPYNSYTRKNIGYLYAIQNGAKYIYDTDDDNAPTVDLNAYFTYEKSHYGIQLNCYINASVINPYAHFGHPQIWPRGYPLTGIQSIYSNEYLCGKKLTPIVQQGLVNGDPDVDAIFRLSYTVNNKRLNISFDSTAPPVQIPITKFSPYNSQNTFFHYDAFWSLYLPKSVSFRLTDIWRSYWSQRLMWYIGGSVSFHGPNAVQIRNPHSYLSDFTEEQDMYLQTEKLIEFLIQWKCHEIRFFGCVIKLTEDMIRNEFFGADELEAVKNWIDDLVSIGYDEPLIEFDDTLLNNTSERCLKSNEFIHNDVFKLRFSPIFQEPVELANLCCLNKTVDPIVVYDEMEKLKFFAEFCGNETILKRGIYDPILPSKNIILLVTFNFEARLDNIVIIKNLYKSYFSNIVFCGKNIYSLLVNTRSTRKKFDEYTFIEFDTYRGYFHYQCATKLIDVGFNADGILLMSDDVLIKPWNILKSLNHTKIWFPEKPICNHELTLNKTTIGKPPWWYHPSGIHALQKLWKNFDEILSRKSETREKDFVNQFLVNLRQNYNFESVLDKVCKTGSDIFYVPKSKFEMFKYISDLFYKHRVFLEFAVPTTLSGLDSVENIDILNGAYFWIGRQFDTANYHKIEHFAHPFKLSRYVNIEKRPLLCNSLIQDMIDQYNSTMA